MEAVDGQTLPVLFPLLLAVVEAEEQDLDTVKFLGLLFQLLSVLL